MRETPRNSMAAVMNGARLLPAYDRHVIRDPAVVWHASLGMRGTLGLRRAPELDLVEVFEAVVLAAFRAQQLVALAGLGYHGVGAEPGGDVALHLGRDRPLHPRVGAVRVLRAGGEHGGVGPARGTFLGDRGGDRGLVREQ